MLKYVLLILFYTHSIFAQFDTLNGVKVPSLATPPFFWRTYFIPNERKPAQFNVEQLPDAHGLMVAVGSIRALVLFSWAPHSTHLLMGDIDPNMVRFNRTHLEFMRRISEMFPQDIRSQRIKYIADLLGFFPKKEQVDIFPKELVLTLETIRNYAEHHPQFCAHFDNSLWPKENSAYLRKIFKANRQANILFDYERIANEYYYWESDALFEKIVSAIEGQRIAVANINLVEWDTICNFIIETGLNWGVLDLSNSCDYRDKKTDNLLWYFGIEQSLFGPKNYLYTAPHQDIRYEFAYVYTNKLGFLNYLASFLGPAYIVYHDDRDDDLAMILAEES